MTSGSVAPVGAPAFLDPRRATAESHQGRKALVRVLLEMPLTRGDVAAEGDDLRISVELFSIALGTPAFHPIFRFPGGHQVSALNPSMRFRRDHAGSDSPSARDTPGFMCDGQWATPPNSHMDSLAMRALELAQGPSGEFSRDHQLACPLLLRLTQ